MGYIPPTPQAMEDPPKLYAKESCRNILARLLDGSSSSPPPQNIVIIHQQSDLFKRLLVNRQIRAKEVRLIDETGKQLGIVSFEEAARLAIERKLDLIQVTQKVEPPVCKLGDYGKYLYQEEKKEKETRKHKGGELKGVRLTFNISLHDLEIRARQAEKFLKKGNKVRIELPLRGREKALQDFAKEKIAKFLEILKGIIPIRIEKELKRESRGFTMIIFKENG